MDYFNEFLFKVIPIHVLELLAAIAGTYYLKNNTNTLLVNTYMIYFLWYTFINELIGTYAPIAYFTNYEYFGFVKNTIFSDNIWLYNIYLIVSFMFFIYYFRHFSLGKKNIRTTNIVILIYLLTSFIYLIYSEMFFKSYSMIVSIVGTLLLLYAIIQFYFNVLKNDIILDLKSYLPIYISVGILVFSLCVAPLDIFFHYFSSENDIFVSLRINILLFANIFMYSTFILGFIICTKKKIK